MIAIFKGYISIDKNAIFQVPVEYNGRVIGYKTKELKDNINADNFVIGESYEIEGITK